MKQSFTTLAIIAVIALFSCKKEDSNTGQNTTNTDTSTTIIRCRNTFTQNFDGNGQLTGTSTSYYTGNRLDSIITTNNGVTTRTIYQDLGNGETKMFIVGNSASYSIIKYDQNYNAIDTRNYYNGSLISQYVSTWECE